MPLATMPYLSPAIRRAWRYYSTYLNRTFTVTWRARTARLRHVRSVNYQNGTFPLRACKRCGSVRPRTLSRLAYLLTLSVPCCSSTYAHAGAARRTRGNSTDHSPIALAQRGQTAATGAAYGRWLPVGRDVGRSPLWRAKERDAGRDKDDDGAGAPPVPIPIAPPADSTFCRTASLMALSRLMTSLQYVANYRHGHTFTLLPS